MNENTKNNENKNNKYGIVFNVKPSRNLCKFGRNKRMNIEIKIIINIKTSIKFSGIIISFPNNDI